MANAPSLAPSNIASLDDAKTEITRLVSIINTLSSQQNSTHNSISSLLKDTVPLWKGVYNSPGNKRLERQVDSWEKRTGTAIEKTRINEAGEVLAMNLKKHEIEENAQDRLDRRNDNHRRYWLRKQVAELKQKQASLLEGRDFYQFTLMNPNKASVPLTELGTKKTAEETKKGALEDKKQKLTELENDIKTEITNANNALTTTTPPTKPNAINQASLKTAIDRIVDVFNGAHPGVLETARIVADIKSSNNFKTDADSFAYNDGTKLISLIKDTDTKIEATKHNITAFEQQIADLEQAKKEAENSTQQELVDKFGSMHPEYLVHLIKDRPDRDNIIEQGLQAIQNHYKELDDMIDKKVTELEYIDQSTGGKIWTITKNVGRRVREITGDTILPSTWQGLKNTGRFVGKSMIVDGGSSLLKWWGGRGARKVQRYKDKAEIATSKEIIRAKDPSIIRTTAKGVGNLATFTGKLAADAAIIAPLKGVIGAGRLAGNTVIGLTKAITFGKAGDIPYFTGQGPSWFLSGNKADDNKQDEKKTG